MYSLFTDEDQEQIRSLGMSLEKVVAEVETFKRQVPYIELDRPCTVADGIKQVNDNECLSLIETFNEYAPRKELLKFVPASGAASRMFKTLLQSDNENGRFRLSEISVQAESGDPKDQQLLAFMEGIKKFAFIDDLRTVMAADGLDLENLVGEGDFKQIITYLLTDKGLNYAELPKGLLKFHEYSEGSRTAFGEHLVEAANYARGNSDESHIHLTVSSEHQAGFTKLFQEIKAQFEKSYNVHFGVTFSVQEKSTDTIAVDLDNIPFRETDGSLLFRPGGHGALLENLNRLSADIIFIKNIDNVVPDRLKEDTFIWKRVLCGHLLKVQKQMFTYLEHLFNKPISTEFLAEIFTFIKLELSILPPPDVDLQSDQTKCDFLVDVLNRPIRVCGMVKNEGEPGGGPFWVEAKNGSLSLQIVESAQINPKLPAQQSILKEATHFNPVDLVCGVRNWQGKAFDLKQYVDSDAVFIARKSKDGRELKGLELPGIWNGAMAFWNTIFVEVPLITFNPVKLVNDLLRDEHQMESSVINDSPGVIIDE